MRQHTKYRAVKAPLSGYNLEFLLVRQKRFLWWRWTVETWELVPDMKPWLGYLTKENSTYLATVGYRWALNEYEPEDFKHFIETYPDIEDYILLFNLQHYDWLKEKEKTAQRPTIISLN